MRAPGWSRRASGGRNSRSSIFAIPLRAGKPAFRGSTLAVWEVLLLVQSYKADVSAVAKHLQWPKAKVQAAVNYAEAFPEEIEGAISENTATDWEALKRMLPQAAEFVSRPASKS